MKLEAVVTLRNVTLLSVLSQQPVFPRERTAETKPLPEANRNEYRKRFVWG